MSSDGSRGADKSAFKTGAATMDEVYSGMVPAGEEGDDRFMDLMVPHIFGRLWDDSKLGISERRLFTMGIIAAMGEYGVFQIQATAALKRGELNAQQLEELCCHAAYYAGLPRAGGLRAAVAAAISDAAG